VNVIHHRVCWLWLLFGSVTLSACTILPEPRNFDVYRLPPSEVATSHEAAVDWGLRISRPASNDLLGSSRIAVMPDGHRLSVYEGARWNSPMPELWRDHLLDAFHNDGRVRNLSSDREILQAEVDLGGLLRAFQVEYRDGRPEVVIRLDANLVDIRSRRILASRRFKVTEAVHDEQLPHVVEAFGRASDALAAEIIDWTLREAGQRE
jgi:cholesterol transport system auxiliary component